MWIPSSQSGYRFRVGKGTPKCPRGELVSRPNVFQLGLTDCQGGKRPYHTTIPALVTRGDDLFMAYGVMGNYMQPQGHVQVLLNILRGFNAQAALDAPRFCIDAEPIAYKGSATSKVFIEEGISPLVVDELRGRSSFFHTGSHLRTSLGMGHQIEYLTGISRSQFGRGQIILKRPDPDGRLIWAAGSDPRADGHAVPQI